MPSHPPDPAGGAGHDQDTVLRFRDVQQAEQAFDYRERGLVSVPLERIVGSVNRYLDFDRQFRLKRDRPRDRLEAVRRAAEQGRPMRPVDLYQVGDRYFVVDGNHRIAVAKERGFREINARVVEFLPSAGTRAGILYRERQEFEEATGLETSGLKVAGQPAAGRQDTGSEDRGLEEPIELTEIGQYRVLLAQIELHRAFLETERGRPVATAEAAWDWYATVYRPLSLLIEKAELAQSFPGRTVADLYAYVSRYQWDRRGEAAVDDGVTEAIRADMEEFRKVMSTKKEQEYPDMLREITVFVLMNISTKKEAQLLDRLFAVPEVREVHSVHGAIDIIVKIVLVRSMLSSDAEVVSRFVQEKIRHIPGVVSTQTLIPGISRIKEE
jgi:DNA-binding Lrp family transcriptional regulator